MRPWKRTEPAQHVHCYAESGFGCNGCAGNQTLYFSWQEHISSLGKNTVLINDSFSRFKGGEFARN